MNFAKIIGIILIGLGLSGFLFIKGNMVGYVISEDDPNKLANEFLEISGIYDIESNSGRIKTLEVNAKNIGDKLLNNCEIIRSGEINSWILLPPSQGIAQGEKIHFMYDLIIPENTETRTYEGNIGIKCDETSLSKDFSINILEGLNTIKIKELKVNNFELNLTYIFDNTNYIGESMSVEIWIINPDGFETLRKTDSFQINRDGLINRNLLISLSKKSLGSHKIFLALSSDSDNYLEETLFIGKPSISGNVTFNTSKGKGTAYTIFLIIIGIGVYLIYRNNKKEVKIGNKSNKIGNSKNEYLSKKP